MTSVSTLFAKYFQYLVIIIMYLNHVSTIFMKAHDKGTFSEALQGECMDVWNVSIGIIFA